MKRELREQQAEAFVGYHMKRIESFDVSFNRWADSKDFRLRDREAIRSIAAVQLGLEAPEPIGVSSNR